jgi:glycogen phosphorylase
MKMALNGALTIGTLDGANIEIMEAVGKENIFIFGLTADQVAEQRRTGYDPRDYYRRDEELRRALDMIASGYFSPREPNLFQSVIQDVLIRGDYYMLLADFRAYVTTQEAVSRLFRDPDEWARRSILNTAHMGRFSSDRAVLEYARKIWQVETLPPMGIRTAEE